MTLNLLQRGLQRGANPPPNVENDPAFAVGFVLGFACAIAALLVLSYAPNVVLLMRQMQALKAVRGRNRGMSPALVWLGLIPVLTYVWTFASVWKTAAALADEFHDRRMRRRGDNGMALGMTYAVLNLVNGGVNVVAFVLGFLGVDAPIGCLNVVLLLVMLVVAVLYVGQLGTAMQRLRRHTDKSEDRDEDFDNDPRKKPRRSRDGDDFE